MTATKSLRPSWQLGRADAAFTRGLLILLAVLYPLAVLVPKVVRWIGGGALEWTTATSTTGPQAPGLGGAGTSVRFDDTVIWTIQHAGAGPWLASLIPGVITWALLVAGCVVGLRLIGSTVAGEPFEAAGVRRVRALALLVIGYGVLVPTSKLFADLGVLWSVDQTASLALVVDVAAIAVPLVIGALILVIAESFAIGRRLAEDVEGLI